jgi:hypothetical protein
MIPFDAFTEVRPREDDEDARVITYWMIFS